VKAFWAKIGDTLPQPAVADMGHTFAGNEVIHAQAYEKLLDALQMHDVFQRNLQTPALSGRVQYLKKYADRVYHDERKQFVYALILFTLFVENVSLFAQFYVISGLNRYKNVLKDAAQQIQYTRHEERVHAQAGIMIINTLRREYPELFDAELDARIYEEVRVAYRHECSVIDWILDGYECEGISAPILKAYIKDRLAQSMQAIGFSALDLTPQERHLVDTETMWMDEETLGVNMTDFFHKKPVEYAKKARAFDLAEMFG